MNYSMHNIPRLILINETIPFWLIQNVCKHKFSSEFGNYFAKIVFIEGKKEEIIDFWDILYNINNLMIINQ